MKNIHLLPTDKPSRLCLDSKDKLWFAPNSGYTIADGKQNIYITSDEEIKIGDWYLNNGHLLKCTELKIRSSCKKIILTTDQDLIKDGVQAIDDEFLEWFIKNPSCKEVEVDFKYENCIPALDDNGNKILKIKIPSKSENLRQIIPKEEYFKKEFLKQKRMSGAKKVNRILEEPKQETLEEAAKKEYNDNLFDYEKYRDGFIEGAKWQAKRMYSEEEVKKAQQAILGNIKDALQDENYIIEYIEQFKNK